MQLVGITGKAGAGKDTIADYLVREQGFNKLSFADTLKRMLALAGMPEPTNRDDKEKLIPGFEFTWREAAQKLGTEWGRALDPDIWIKILELRIQRETALDAAYPGVKPSRFVLSDVRFDNEAEMIRRLGGQVLHVTGRAAKLGASAGHASEAGVFFDGHHGDRELDNSGSIVDTIKQLQQILWSAA